jgi:periplasmic divalent cation tolerance protein
MAALSKGLAMPDCKEVDILTVTTTVGSLDDARRLARGLVEAHVAACVQIDAIAASVYRWEGRLREDPEHRLTIKTLPTRFEAVQLYFREHHPYEVPQCVAVRCTASTPYGQWVAAESA